VQHYGGDKIIGSHSMSSNPMPRREINFSKVIIYTNADSPFYIYIFLIKSLPVFINSSVHQLRFQFAVYFSNSK